MHVNPRSLFHTGTQQVVVRQLKFDHLGVEIMEHRIHSDLSDH